MNHTFLHEHPELQQRLDIDHAHVIVDREDWVRAQMTTQVKTKKVIDVLLTEREYQKKRWGTRQADGSFTENAHSVGNYLLFMQDYLTEAIHRASREDGFDGALDSLRKVMALGIRCFEEHGIPSRDPLIPVINARDGLSA